MKNKFSLLGFIATLLFSVFLGAMMISCSSSSDDDEPAGEWQNWSTMNLCIALDQSNYETLKGVGSDIPVDFGSMRCYVDKQYYSISCYQNWVFYLQDGSFLFSNETLYFFEKDGMAYMLANGNESIYISKTLNDPFKKNCRNRIYLGLYNTPGGGGGGGSTSGYTLYKTVTALVLTEVQHDITKTSYESVGIYKKSGSSSYYIKLGTNLYQSLSKTKSSKNDWVDVSGYNYFTIKSTSSTSVMYWYYVNL